ncbi:hypothetical protein F0562_024964 [Nyssa sinensis]|uniref:Uncharacterized protein n=1 Tax=Nyssa sinensis TaxID=561372 RepID=A0A5J5BE79_9ASTE|nr:hypothetical protein F0562_024964 [Nyssa sinensis]
MSHKSHGIKEPYQPMDNDVLLTISSYENIQRCEEEIEDIQIQRHSISRMDGVAYEKRKAFDQRGDIAIAAWAEQQQWELNSKI